MPKTKKPQRPTPSTWKLDRSRPLNETVTLATHLVVQVYREALEKLSRAK